MNLTEDWLKETDQLELTQPFLRPGMTTWARERMPRLPVGRAFLTDEARQGEEQGPPCIRAPPFQQQCPLLWTALLTFKVSR